MEAALAQEIKFVIIACLVAVGLISWAMVACVRAMARERSRRELFAYVAEGSISPAQAKELMEAESIAIVHKGITDAVSWGMISAKDAEGLIRGSGKQASDADPKPA